MKVAMKRVDEVLPYGKNPRRNAKAVDAVAESIRQFGWKQPIVVDKELVIIVGHTRWLAAQKLGIEKVPVVIATDLTPDKVKAYRLADNKTNELAEWDVGLLSEELKELSEAGWNDFTSLAFSTTEVDQLLSPLAEKVFEAARPTVASAAAEQIPEDEDEDDSPPDYINKDVKPTKDEDEREENAITTYSETVLFSSSNWLGFPDIRQDMLWDGDIRRVYIKDEDTAPTQMIAWSSVGIDERMTGHVINFYADDERFEHAIWENHATFLEKIDRLKPAAMVVPDFSMFLKEPTAFNVWQAYRARWCARYWQEAGHKLVLNIQTCRQADWDWIFLGMPKRCPTASIEVRSSQGDEENKQARMRGIHEWCRRIDTGKIFIYGAEHREWVEPNLPKQGPEFVWLESYHKARKSAGLF